MATTPPPRPASANALRHLGRFQLLRLLGKSERSMLWLVADPQLGQDLVLALPRAQPANAAALQRWLDNARKASRIDHPGLARAVEVGEHERWPYIAYDRGSASTLAERMSPKGLAPAELVPWVISALQGLAFAHEAGLAHHDVQAAMLLLQDGGGCRLMGLGVALPPVDDGADQQARRQAAERDVLCLGLVLHNGLAGAPALDLPDVGQALLRLPPLGRDMVRLAASGAHPIPEALRTIVNRSTDRQERQRYRNARTFERALAGWLKADSEPGAGPVALLLDRMRSTGLLPAMPGGSARASRLSRMEREHSLKLADVALQDLGLAFELLRSVNGARMRDLMGRSGRGAAGATPAGAGAGGGSSSAVLTVRRAIALVGLDGVRRAGLSLRPWPGPLNPTQAIALAGLIERVCLAGKVAQWLRPAGYDAEVVYLVAMLQNLGRLAVQYHFPDEAVQIVRLMQTSAPASTGEPEEPGMSEEAAAFAVLGVDIETLGAAVGRHWGLDDSVLQMIRRVPVAQPVHAPDGDDDLLRLTGSCANEVVDARAVPAAHRSAALHRVVQRYGRILGVTLQEVQLAVQGQSPQDQDGAETVALTHLLADPADPAAATAAATAATATPGAAPLAPNTAAQPPGQPASAGSNPAGAGAKLAELLQQRAAGHGPAGAARA